MNRGASIVRLSIWSLLFVWLFFGCVELVEQADTAPEAVAEEQTGQDLDQEALLQLASGLKPDVPSLAAPGYASCTTGGAAHQFHISVDSLHWREQRCGHGPPSRRLHQQLSIYRI